MVGESTFGSYGIGWFLDEFNGHRIVQHGGASGTEYLKYPDDDVTVIVLTNLEQLAGGDATLLAKTIAQAYVSGLTWSELTVRGDPDPQLGQIVLAELKNLATGAMNEALYAPAYAKLLAPTLPSQKAGLTQLGPIEACEYVGGRNMGVVRAAYYRVHFRALTVYATIHLDKERKIVKFTLQADTILGN
jgi:D-alanyl-D-alanine carboxypeptidase